MTDIKNYKSGEPFKFIVHNLTKDDFDDEFITSVISASLITDKTMGVYNYWNNSRVGFILFPDHIIAASEKDCYTNNENKDNLFKQQVSIKTPKFIENYCIKTCKKINGEILSDEKEAIYSEIVMSGFYPIAIYAITNGEKEISNNYRRATQLNKKYLFNFIDIDKSIYRKKYNLEPITIKEQKELCKDLLMLLNINYSEELINKYYKIIYEEFMNLKISNKYDSNKLLDIGKRLIKI